MTTKVAFSIYMFNLVFTLRICYLIILLLFSTKWYVEPNIAFAMDADPDLTLRLGQPGVEIGPMNWYRLEQYLSPDFELPQAPISPIHEIETHILLENFGLPENVQRPLAEAEQLVPLKNEILNRMKELDPHPFWEEKRGYLVARSLLRKDGQFHFMEYFIPDLQSKLSNLNRLGETSSIFRELRQIRIYSQRFPNN